MHHDRVDEGREEERVAGGASRKSCSARQRASIPSYGSCAMALRAASHEKFNSGQSRLWSRCNERLQVVGHAIMYFICDMIPEVRVPCRTGTLGARGNQGTLSIRGAQRVSDHDILRVHLVEDRKGVAASKTDCFSMNFLQLSSYLTRVHTLQFCGSRGHT